MCEYRGILWQQNLLSEQQRLNMLAVIHYMGRLIKIYYSLVSINCCQCTATLD